MKVWTREGDNAEYHSHDSLQEAIDSLVDLIADRDEPVQVSFRELGVEFGPFTGHNYISLFWGEDADPSPVRALSPQEKDCVCTALTA